ncbi:HAMP domain-containing sensor histidine kinase [Pleionea sp. CnH1-48]|uniref:sensor histidine kinase n=1 Tax=Pleionea sp. CnH1-48 TaxID=2954494 RepID=UPI0020982A30|nr:ATP-binding protein [Pleionea sp. CnH1-48]MCO7224238.1 ATP-binding protein [Pleionea sp. CnH1-48]
MRRIKSLFWQLYLSILLSIALAIGLFVGLLMVWDSQTSYQDFHRDTQAVATPILSEWHRKGKVDSELLEQVGEESFFHLAIVAQKQLDSLLESAEYIETVRSTRLYQKEASEQMISVRKLSGAERWLVISDIEHDPYAEGMSRQMQEELIQEAEDDDRQQLALLLMTIMFFTVLSVVLLWQIKRLKQTTDALIATSQRWAEGDFSAKANENIPSPLDSLAKSYNNMATALDIAMAEQKVMTHAMSHELRTPLNKVQLAVSLLERKYPELKNEELRIDLERYVEELEQLTSQMLTYARFNALRKNSVSDLVSFAHLVKERVQALETLYPDKSVVLKLQDVMVVGEVFPLQIMIDNLLRNALKYSHQFVKIELTIDGQYALLQMVDDGQGVAPEYQSSIFSPFYRVDGSRNKSSGGFGLGLAIVDAIVRQHQGDIQVESEAGKGFCIGIRLPLSNKDTTAY